MTTTIGNLRRGDIFVFKGDRYKSGDILIHNDEDCVVSCENVTTHERKFFTLETIVALVERRDKH